MNNIGYWVVLVSSILFLGLVQPESVIEQREAETEHDPVALFQIPIKVTRVKDADTIVADVNFPWDVTLREQTIRAANFDAWELTRHRRTVDITDEEIEKGQQAKTALENLILEARAFYVVPVGKDVYGRLTAKWLVIKDGRLIRVAKWAKENGHVRQ